MQQQRSGEGPVEEARRERLVMVVLVGLIGSGKSSFAKALQEYYPDYVRCNQDTLGSRKAVQAYALRALESGHNVVIDRTNVDESQRATWVDLARSLSNVEVQAFYFDTPLETCKARLAIRMDHETIRDPDQALKVLQSFHRDLTRPVHSEGFQRIIFIQPIDFASALPTQTEVNSIMKRAAGMPLVDIPIVRTTTLQQQSYRGRGRGRGGGGQWQQMRGRGNQFYNSSRGAAVGAAAAADSWRRAAPVQQQSGYPTYSNQDRFNTYRANENTPGSSG